MILNILLDIDTTSLILSGVVPTVVILALVLVLIFAAKYLVQQGDVQIVINNEKTITVAAGGTLLTALANEKIFLPSACGGGGTCAMCKFVISEGGGDILPTETGHINRKAQKEGVRLTCQVKVKNNMKIQIPDEIFGIKKWVSGHNTKHFWS
jgi:Na+-transporting NADH:ubiquinone oxidoreductase subunit F